MLPILKMINYSTNGNNVEHIPKSTNNGGLVNKLGLGAVLLSSILYSNISRAVVPEPRFDLGLENIGFYDTKTRELDTILCITEDGDDVLDENGNAAAYEVIFKNRTKSEGGGFKVTKGTLYDIMDGFDCSGSFDTETGMYEDIVDAGSIGTWYVQMERRSDESGYVFDLTDEISKLKERDLGLNSVELGTDLGSFESDISRSYSLGSAPASYALTAPQCSDKQGDSTMVNIKRDGGLEVIVEPGSDFSINLKVLSIGSYKFEAFCNDTDGLKKKSLDVLYGQEIPADGALSVSISQAPVSTPPTPTQPPTTPTCPEGQVYDIISETCLDI